MSIGQKIKELRLSDNMTQTEFGNKFGIVKSTVSLYESGKSTPNDEIKIKICEYFNVSMDYLLGITNSISPTLDNNMQTTSESLIQTTSEDEKDLLIYFRNLSRKDQRLILVQMENMLHESNLSVAADDGMDSITKKSLA